MKDRGHGEPSSADGVDAQDHRCSVERVANRPQACDVADGAEGKDLRARRRQRAQQDGSLQRDGINARRRAWR